MLTVCSATFGPALHSLSKYLVGSAGHELKYNRDIMVVSPSDEHHDKPHILWRKEGFVGVYFIICSKHWWWGDFYEHLESVFGAQVRKNITHFYLKNVVLRAMKYSIVLYRYIILMVSLTNARCIYSSWYDCKQLKTSFCLYWRSMEHYPLIIHSSSTWNGDKSQGSTKCVCCWCCTVTVV